MADKVNLKEFAKGYATPSSWFKSFGIVSKFLILVGIGWAIYVTFILPHLKTEPTQTQNTVITSPAKVEIDQRQIVNSREIDRFFFGLKFKLIWWPVKIGISMPQEVKEAEVKPVVVE